MAKNPVSSWDTAIGAIWDGLKAPILFPGTAAILFGIYALPTILAQRLQSPDTSVSELYALIALVIVASLGALVLVIPIMRVYAGGTFTLSLRIVLRMIGYGLLVVAMAIVAMIAVWGVMIGLSALAVSIGGDISVTHWAVILLILPIWWMAMRLTTLFPALALDERGPVLRRSFGETKGYVGYFLLTMLFIFIVLIIPVMIAILIIGFAGAMLFDPTQPLSLGTQLVGVAINSALGIFSLFYSCALYGRFFRAVRGIGLDPADLDE